jgi:hypothetical protein
VAALSDLRGERGVAVVKIGRGIGADRHGRRLGPNKGGSEDGEEGDKQAQTMAQNVSWQSQDQSPSEVVDKPTTKEVPTGLLCAPRLAERPTEIMVSIPCYFPPAAAESATLLPLTPASMTGSEDKIEARSCPLHCF